MTRLVLASASPRRRSLLAAVGRPPDDVVAAEVDERAGDNEDAVALVGRLARAKCEAVARAGAGAVVLAADTTVSSAGGVLLGKPGDDDEARAMLLDLAGTVATVTSGVAVGGTGARALAVVLTRVRFRPLGADEVDRYVATGEPRGVAGGFRLQGAGAGLVAAVTGCPTNVVGLPVCETTRLLRAAGLEVGCGRCATTCPATVRRVRAAGDG